MGEFSSEKIFPIVLLLLGAVALTLIYFIFNLGKCNYEVISKVCKDDYTEILTIKNTDCSISSKDKSCAEYGFNFYCDRLVGKCVGISSTTSPLTTSTTIYQPICISKTLWTYCKDDLTICDMVEDVTCKDNIICRSCQAGYKCVFLSSTEAECREVFDFMPIQPAVQRATVEETLLRMGEPVNCVVNSYRVHLTSEGYKILEVKTNPIAPYGTSGGYCWYTGWVDSRVSIDTVVISTQSPNFWATYEHEKCHLVNKHIAADESTYLLEYEPICRAAGQIAIFPSSLFYKTPSLTLIQDWKNL